MLTRLVDKQTVGYRPTYRVIFKNQKLCLQEEGGGGKGGLEVGITDLSELTNYDMYHLYITPN